MNKSVKVVACKTVQAISDLKDWFKDWNLQTHKKCNEINIKSVFWMFCKFPLVRKKMLWKEVPENTTVCVQCLIFKNYSIMIFIIQTLFSSCQLSYFWKYHICHVMLCWFTLVSRFWMTGRPFLPLPVDPVTSVSCEPNTFMTGESVCDCEH